MYHKHSTLGCGSVGIHTLLFQKEDRVGTMWIGG
jgi:hypothetical protein